MLLTISDLLRWGWVAADATLLLLIFRRKLLMAYPYFAIFIATEWVQMIAGLLLPAHSPLYAKVWTVSELFVLLAAIFASLEITKKVLSHYPNIAGFASSSFGIIFGLGVMSGAALTIPFIGSHKWLSSETYWMMRVLRWESLAIFIFLASQAVWFKIFPIEMKPNVALQRWLLALYVGGVPGFSVSLSDYFDHNYQALFWINMCMMACEVAIVFCWCFMMTSKGDIQPKLTNSATEYDLRKLNAAYAEAVRNLERDLASDG